MLSLQNRLLNVKTTIHKYKTDDGKIVNVDLEKYVDDLVQNFINSFQKLYKNNLEFKKFINRGLKPFLKGGKSGVMNGGGSKFIIFMMGLLLSLCYTSFGMSMMTTQSFVAFRKINLQKMTVFFENLDKLPDPFQKVDTYLNVGEISGLLKGVDEDAPGDDNIVVFLSVIDGVVEKCKNVVEFLETNTVGGESFVLSAFKKIKNVKGFGFLHKIFEINSFGLKVISSIHDVKELLISSEINTQDYFNVGFEIIEMAALGMELASVLLPQMIVPSEILNIALYPKEKKDTLETIFLLIKKGKEDLHKHIMNHLNEKGTLINFAPLSGGHQRSRRRRFKKSLKRTRHR